jgi:hypothetical protein
MSRKDCGHREAVNKLVQKIRNGEFVDFKKQVYCQGNCKSWVDVYPLYQKAKNIIAEEDKRHKERMEALDGD